MQCLQRFYLGLLKKGKAHPIAELHKTDSDVWGHSRGGRTLFNSLINLVLKSSRPSRCTVERGV